MCATKWELFSSLLWHLLVTLLLLFCNSPSVTYSLVYHEGWIRASPFLKTVKEILLTNSFALDNISISNYLPLHLCGSVFLVPPPEEPTGYIHPLWIGANIVYHSPCNTLHNCCLPPPHVLPYLKNSYHLQRRIHQFPLQSPAVAPPLRHPRDPSWNPVMEALQYWHHHIRSHPYFTPI